MAGVAGLVAVLVLSNTASAVVPQVFGPMGDPLMAAVAVEDGKKVQ